MAIFMLLPTDVMKKSADCQLQKTSTEHLWQYLLMYFVQISRIETAYNSTEIYIAHV